MKEGVGLHFVSLCEEGKEDDEEEGKRWNGMEGKRGLRVK